MQKTVVINIVGLTSHLIGKHTPFISQWSENGSVQKIKPVLPAVTCSAQYTYLTGKWPQDHGIVGNGWYFRTEKEVKFWRQSNDLVQAPKIWEVAKAQDSSFTCANMFWWYNMYASVDYAATPRPNYLSNGLKIPDCYTHPADLRDDLQKELGTFPLFSFWGPNTNISSSRWIADASMLTDQKYDPTLTLIYLPHLDYNLQRHGHGHPSIAKDLQEIDAVVKDLVQHFEYQGAQVILLSGYGITDVNRPIHLNRIFRKKGWLALRREQSWELLDAGASKVFAVADHQIAHIYVQDQSLLSQVKATLEATPGVGLVLDETTKQDYHIDHPRAGEIVAVADNDSWFTYYFWNDEDQAPDYARTVDIHKKPGYDPVEMFVNPKFAWPMGAVAWRLLKKKLGFRYMMDVIPLDATLIKGSHGNVSAAPAHFPICIRKGKPFSSNDTIQSTDVFDLILDTLNG